MRIGIVCSGWAFMPEIMAELEKHHEVSTLEDPLTPERIRVFMKYLDVVYVEWCASYMAAVTQEPKLCPIVNRLHRHEMYGPWMSQVDFSQIDTLIFVNDFIRDRALAKHPTMATASEMKVIQLGVDTDLFTFDQKREYGKVIGWVGYLKPRKDPLAMLDLMRDLPDWELRLHGFPSAYPDLTREVSRRVAEQPNVVWDQEFIPREDMPGFYNQFDVFVNTSKEEGQGVAILEAMSCGVYTQTADWPHARQLYRFSIVPGMCVYQDPKELVERIRYWDEAPDGCELIISDKMRDFVMDRYNAKDYVRKMREAIENAAT